MLNGIGITSIEMNQPRLMAGQPVEADWQARTYAQSILAQVSTVTYTGGSPGNGVYSVTIVRPDGTSVVSSTAALTSPSLTDIAVAVKNALNGNADLIGYMTADNAAGVLTITFDESYAGVSFAVSASTQAGTTATVATAQDAASVPSDGIEIGRAVVRVNDAISTDSLTYRMRLPTGGDAESAIVGIVLRDLSQPNSGSISPSAEEHIDPGSLAAVAYNGVVAVKNARGTAAPGGTVYVQITANGGVEPGQIAASADGGNSVTLGANRAVWLDNVAAGAVGRVRIHMIG